MKERGLIFTRESIPGLQSGAKTQSRRVVRPQPGPTRLLDHNGTLVEVTDRGFARWLEESRQRTLRCPYGVPGDLIWVKEAFALLGKQTIYRADKLSQTEGYSHVIRNGGRWKSPRFMPKVAARIWLELTGVRVERLQNIRAGDVIREGFFDQEGLGRSKAAFSAIWDELNAKRGFPWESNPWVWVLEFRRCERDA